MRRCGSGSGNLSPRRQKSKPVFDFFDHEAADGFFGLVEYEVSKKTQAVRHRFFRQRDNVQSPTVTARLFSLSFLPPHVSQGILAMYFRCVRASYRTSFPCSGVPYC
jgi:hypothetical protein